MERVRKYVQSGMALLANGSWEFPWSRTISYSPLKVLCSPGLNCYSCPASTTYCPLGALQQLWLALRLNLDLGQLYLGAYVLGSVGLIGAAIGRIVCGWICPFGLIQELLYKIPSRKFSISRSLRWGKYILLIFLVVLLPMVWVGESGLGRPWFCKYVCPAGTLEAGLPMVLLQPELRATLGWLWWNKFGILLGFVLWSIVASRPFCRVACPLGAWYGLFNRHALIRLRLDRNRCTGCEACHAVCPTGVRFNEKPGDAECIVCLRCLSACKVQAIQLDVAGLALARVRSRARETVRKAG
ncbi:MAG: (4Fe-4S)-binding protein [Desulfobulbaceae bacterium A2]|nr:MAG: (4Fe-4S)-binding protein [Desulfobulbaceae bacterium A2]